MGAIFSNISRVVFLPLFTVQILSSQSQTLTTTASLSDWGFTSPKDIRFGVLSVIHGPGSDRLSVNTLRPATASSRRTTSPVIPQENKTFPAHPRTKPLSRATWIWNTDSLLIGTEEEDALISTIIDGHFDRVFLQVPRNFADDTSNDVHLRTLVSRLRERGASVCALTGGSEFSLPGNHSLVARIIRRVSAYNENAPDNARFVGFHLDTEPYLLPGFNGPRREWILNQYLTVIELAARLCHSQGLIFGADIPFWFNFPDEFTGIVDSIEFSGTKKTVNEFVTDWADEICIMSYRTSADGANGLVSISNGELRYAETKGKTVFVGLETSKIFDEDHYYFRGIPATDTTMLGVSDRVVVMSVSGDSAKIFLATRPEAYAIINDRSGGCCSADSLFFWEVSNSSHISSAKLSFAGLGRKRLEETIGTVTRQLSGFLSFGGVAIHHAESYAKLRE